MLLDSLEPPHLLANAARVMGPWEVIAAAVEALRKTEPPVGAISETGRPVFSWRALPVLSIRELFVRHTDHDLPSTVHSHHECIA